MREVGAIVVEWDDIRSAGHLRKILVTENLTHTLSVVARNHWLTRELPSLHSALVFLKGRIDHAFRECFRHCGSMLRGVDGACWPNVGQSSKIFPIPDAGNVVGLVEDAGFRRPPVLCKHLWLSGFAKQPNSRSGFPFFDSGVAHCKVI